MNKYFENILIGDEITLDIDIFVEDWLLLAKDAFIGKICDIEEKFNIPLVVYYRESCHRNVHIKLKFPAPLSMFEVLLFRAWLDDDQTLLYLDMKRYFKLMDAEHHFMRRFDCKGTINDKGQMEITKAGPWRALEIPR